MCHYMPEESKVSLRINLNRCSHSQKLRNLIFESNNAMVEMRHHYEQQKSVSFVMVSRHWYGLQQFNYLLAVIINLTMLMSITGNNDGRTCVIYIELVYSSSEFLISDLRL